MKVTREYESIEEMGWCENEANETSVLKMSELKYMTNEKSCVTVSQ